MFAAACNQLGCEADGMTALMAVKLGCIPCSYDAESVMDLVRLSGVLRDCNGDKLLAGVWMSPTHQAYFYTTAQIVSGLAAKYCGGSQLTASDAALLLALSGSDQSKAAHASGATPGTARGLLSGLGLSFFGGIIGTLRGERPGGEAITTKMVRCVSSTATGLHACLTA